MWLLILMCTALVFAVGYYYFVVKTKKEILWYKANIQKLGYRVKLYPFQFFGSSVVNIMKHDQEKYGDGLYSQKRNDSMDVGIFNVFHFVIIQLYNPDLIQQFLGPDNPEFYHKYESLVFNFRRSIGQSIGFIEGKQWKSRRKLMNHVFNYEFIKSIIPKIVKVCNKNFEVIEEQFYQENPSHDKNSVKLDLQEAYSRLFSDVMFESFFGIETTKEKIKDKPAAIFLSNLMKEINQQTFKIPSLLLGEKYLELGLTAKDKMINSDLKIIKEFAKEKIKSRLKLLQKEGASQEYTDIIQALSIKKIFDINAPLEPEMQKLLVAEFCGFFTAGTSTISHFTQMALYYISLNSQVERKLRNQISEFIKSDEDITYENLKKMKYLDLVELETTRMYGPGNGTFTRYATKDHLLKGIPIKKGIGMMINSVPTHYDERYYKDPFTFKPERWEKQCEDNPPYALCGFSGGPRSCLGKHLAYLQGKIAIIKFLMRFKSFQLPKKDFKIIVDFISFPEKMELTANFA